jgi:hypothetical protein
MRLCVHVRLGIKISKVVWLYPPVLVLQVRVIFIFIKLVC